MHPNLERRLVSLEVARGMLAINLEAVKTRFYLLFDNLAKDMGITHAELARRLAWEPFPDGGNAVSKGEADPSPEDCYRLLDIYLSLKPDSGKRCERCGWPLKTDPRDGCTPENCCMRPLLDAGERVAEIFQ